MRILGALLLCAAGAAWAAPSLDEARKLYEYTDYQGSLDLLRAEAVKDAAVLHLMGRNYYMLGDYKRATDFLEKAVAAQPSNSEYVNWLGKAYGRRAETSTFLTAMGHAGKARQYFEKAVQIDPGNLEALNDLFEYYLEAPGFLGGGFDKAARLAERISSLDEAEGHWAQAKLAEHRKEFGSAEEQLRRAAEMAPQQVGRLIDLGRFLALHGKYVESEQSFQEAERLAPNNPKLLYARADTYIRTNRNLDTARKLLKRYLRAQLNPDCPPRSEAEKLLKQVGG